MSKKNIEEINKIKKELKKIKKNKKDTILNYFMEYKDNKKVIYPYLVNFCHENLSEEECKEINEYLGKDSFILNSDIDPIFRYISEQDYQIALKLSNKTIKQIEKYRLKEEKIFCPSNIIQELVFSSNNPDYKPSIINYKSFYYANAVINYKLDNRDTSIMIANKGLEYMPNDFALYSIIAMASVDSKDYEEVRDLCIKAISYAMLPDEISSIYFQLGLLEYEYENLYSAITCLFYGLLFNDSIEIKAKLFEIYSTLDDPINIPNMEDLESALLENYIPTSPKNELIDSIENIIDNTENINHKMFLYEYLLSITFDDAYLDNIYELKRYS